MSDLSGREPSAFSEALSRELVAHKMSGFAYHPALYPRFSDIWLPDVIRVVQKYSEHLVQHLDPSCHN